MKYDPNIHHRRSIRLKGYDYSQAGAYFVTVNTHQSESLFGEIVNGEMQLNDWGQIVAQWWNDIPEHFPHADTDEFIIMPNHVHGILIITDEAVVRARFPRPDAANETDAETPAGPGQAAPISNESSVRAGSPRPDNSSPIKRPTLGKIIAYFKYQSTKHLNLVRDQQGAPVWHRNYYERVIRNERELDATRLYIFNNPTQWMADSEKLPQ